MPPPPQHKTLKKTILVVDDCHFTQQLLHATLSDKYEISAAETGSDCLMFLQATQPDLILLDIEMPGMDGLETCAEVRKRYTGPIIFVSSRNDTADQQQAFEAGCDNFIAKPIDCAVLRHHVRRTLDTYSQIDTLTLEKDTMSRMAMDLLDTSSERSALLEFMQDNIDSQHEEDIVRQLVNTLRDFGVSAIVDVRLPEYTTRFGSDDAPLSAAEASMLGNASEHFGIFLYKNRLLINHYSTSILVRNLPADRDAAVRMQHSLQTLLGAFESLLQTVLTRRNFATTTESLQVAALRANESAQDLLRDYTQQQLNTQMLLHGLIEKIERAYFSMGLTEAQEDQISHLLRVETDAVMDLFASGAAVIDQKFSEIFKEIMDVLAPPKAASSDVWL